MSAYTPSACWSLPKLPAWQKDALCAGMVLFDQLTTTEQQRFCTNCEVRAECLAWALNIELREDHQPQGTYGGVSATERARMRRKIRAQMRTAAG